MNSKILHSDRDLYFLCRNEPKPHNDKWATVSCEIDEFGKAVRAYFSPLDAMIDAFFHSNSTGRYRAIPSAIFDLSDLIADHDNQLAVSFQVAWAAHANQILLRPSGKLAACSIAKCCQINDDESAIYFPSPGLAQKLHKRLLEISGIEGWEKSVNEFKSLPSLKRDEIAINAIRRIPATCSGRACDELVLYDLNAGQWKFSPYSLVEDLLRGYES
ncbi:hypothetical protein [Burkholderia sp. IMCC1007]|uniref:hypothetical protein n=1 Tax=Burkholderia sp. IMCC1007 TaxID=3004104 RepID=UPI0022B4FE7D|nr:hypothetical protein [Burkholderia sp. IMCC1007]